MTQPLSPDAKAGELILAYRRGADEVPHPLGLAAALRVVSDQSENLYDQHEGKVSVVRVEKLLAIATELEAHQ